VKLFPRKAQISPAKAPS